jgi:hypothetical protein
MVKKVRLPSPPKPEAFTVDGQDVFMQQFQRNIAFEVCVKSPPNHRHTALAERFTQHETRSKRGALSLWPGMLEVWLIRLELIRLGLFQLLLFWHGYRNDRAFGLGGLEEGGCGRLVRHWCFQSSALCLRHA